MSTEGYSAEEVDNMADRIAETFSGKTVLVTGGTGFMGKVLVEKLLRKCPELGCIALLVRTKKGKTPKQRLEDMFSNPLFDKLKASKGGVEPLVERMRIVPGDVQEPDLGLSKEDRQYLIEETHMVIHAAATIRFDEELKKAVLLNVRGTKLILELAKECKKLELFVHISTAYCHLHEKLLEEKPYAPPADPHQIIEAMEWMDDETIAAVTPKLLNKLPNSYAFTKSLGEALAVEAMAKIPVVILRPSIVIPIWQEPVPGWTDNINGPTGLLIEIMDIGIIIYLAFVPVAHPARSERTHIGIKITDSFSALMKTYKKTAVLCAGKGVIRTMYCKSNSYADYLPVDVFINGIMIVTWNYLKYGDKKSNVVNFTSSAEIKVTWSEMIDAGREIIMNRVPLNGVAWYPGGSMKHSRLYHNICSFFFHWVPAFIVDVLLFCLGYKPVLMRVQRRISKGFEVFEYYTNNQWDFKSDIAQTVRQRLNARERRDYKVDAIGLDISAYFEDCIRAARVFILKEYDDTLPAARRHMKVMWFVDVVVRFLFWGYLMYCLMGWTSSLFTWMTGASDEMVTPTIMTS